MYKAYFKELYMYILAGKKKLQKLENEELIKGNLPMEEVEEGIRELERRLGI